MNTGMKSITGALPIISIVIIAISFLNLAFYYSQFGVQIQNYVEVSEIIFSLTTFFSSAFFLVVFAILLLVITGFGSKGSSDRLKNADDKNSQEMFASYRKSKHRFVRFFFSFFSEKIFIAVIIAAIAFGIWDGVRDAMTTEALKESVVWFDISGLVLVFVTSAIPATLCIPGRAMKDADETYKITFFLSLIILSTQFLIVRNQRRAELVKAGNPKYSMILVLSDTRTYTSNDTLLYVGSTKNFIFFYNARKQSTVAISGADVRASEIKALRGGL